MKYFSIDELTASSTSKVKSIDNTPTPGIRQNLENLINKVLDPVRELWGGPITVNSGYRSPALNAAVKGSKSSHHMLGMAADITVGNKSNNKKLFNLIKNSGLPFTQLIDEKNFSWIHISYDPNNVKRQVLKL